ncbi:hypothetical protein [uncultured Formosa sp.]|uniref:hypothetical protein n=1 Tax=uncultured Formosa sp. TaxID=255435 RepID=UPI00262CE9A6|nr:hypothetical protein [uncultured Formosa sp.]
MKVILILAFFSVINLFSQENVDRLTSDLEIENLEFGQKPSKDLKLSPNILKNGTSDANFTIKHKIFKEVNYNFDQRQNLQRVSLDFKNSKTIEKYGEEIYKILEKHYGIANKLFKNGYTNTYKFQSKDFEYDLAIYYGSMSEYSGLTIRKINIFVKEKYDEFSKTTYLIPQNNGLFLETENGEELSVEFIGMIKNQKKELLMKIGSQSSNWKFLDEIIVLTSDGETERFELTTKREVNSDFGFTEESTLFALPIRLIEKINNIDDVKFRVRGKTNYDFSLGQMQFQTYLKIKEELNKK